MPVLQHASDEAAALKLHIHELEAQLSSLETAQHKMEVAEAARDQAVTEAGRYANMLSNLEARLQQV